MIRGIIIFQLFFVATVYADISKNPIPNFDSLNAKEKGHAIAVETDRRDSGWGDFQADVKMILIDNEGNQTVNHIRSKFLEVAGDGDKEINIFDHPKYVRGTANLTFSHSLEPDEQWIYLPSVKRIKRISSRNKSGPFMGSEFAFEDLASWEVEKYSYEYIKDEAMNGKDCFVVKNIPAYEHSGYSYRIEWVDKEIFRPVRIDYYDRKKALLKSMVMKDYRLYLDRYWRAHEITMSNHQTGKKTLVTWDNLKFNVGFKESDFTPAILTRVR